MMKQELILHPTDTSQWYALILDAESSACVHLAEDTESYLVFLLMRSSQNTIWLNSILGMDYMHALQESGQKQRQMLKDVGDKSLLLSGFFSDSIKKFQLTPQYYIDIGQLAYARLGAQPNDAQQALYFTLSEQFLSLREVLQAAQKKLSPSNHSSLF